MRRRSKALGDPEFTMDTDQEGRSANGGALDNARELLAAARALLDARRARRNELAGLDVARFDAQTGDALDRQRRGRKAETTAGQQQTRQGCGVAWLSRGPPDASRCSSHSS